LFGRRLVEVVILTLLVLGAAFAISTGLNSYWPAGRAVFSFLSLTVSGAAWYAAARGYEAEDLNAGNLMPRSSTPRAALAENVAKAFNVRARSWLNALAATAAIFAIVFSLTLPSLKELLG